MPTDSPQRVQRRSYLESGCSAAPASVAALGRIPSRDAFLDRLQYHQSSLSVTILPGHSRETIFAASRMFYVKLKTHLANTCRCKAPLNSRLFVPTRVPQNEPPLGVSFGTLAFASWTEETPSGLNMSMCWVESRACSSLN